MLGDSSPDILRDTMVYMCGLYFALRGGMELRRLMRKQLSIHELSNGDSTKKWDQKIIQVGYTTERW